ncbi:MAG: hypothetical protein Q7T85_14400 [Nitrosomonas sp.]|nr:hypothetical protein [Nitrosomonas sp.]
MEYLEEYEEHCYYYGKQGQDFKSHTQVNIRYYEQVASRQYLINRIAG